MTRDQLQLLLGDPHAVNVLGIAAVVAVAGLLAALYILAHFQILSYALYMVPHAVLVAFSGTWALRGHAGEAGALLVFGALALGWAIYPPGYPFTRVLTNDELEDEDEDEDEGPGEGAAKPAAPAPPIELVP